MRMRAWLGADSDTLVTRTAEREAVKVAVEFPDELPGDFLLTMHVDQDGYLLLSSGPASEHPEMYVAGRVTRHPAGVSMHWFPGLVPFGQTTNPDDATRHLRLVPDD